MAAGSYDYVIVGAGYALRRYVGRPMAPWPGAPAMAPSSTVNYGCTAWTACGWWTPR